MPTDATPPWMLWTALTLSASAALGLIAGSLRARRRRYPTVTPTLTFQPLPSSAHLPIPPPPGSSRTSQPAGFIPAPAPLAPSLTEGQHEQRADYRRAGNPVLVLVAGADTQRRPWNAWVIDRSRRGLRLAMDHKPALGQVYTVRPAQAPPATPWSAIEIRHCAEVDGHWEVGCRFLQAPAVPLLMLFG